MLERAFLVDIKTDWRDYILKNLEYFVLVEAEGTSPRQDVVEYPCRFLAVTEYLIGA